MLAMAPNPALQEFQSEFQRTQNYIQQLVAVKEIKDLELSFIGATVSRGIKTHGMTPYKSRVPKNPTEDEF